MLSKRRVPFIALMAAAIAVAVGLIFFSDSNAIAQEKSSGARSNELATSADLQKLNESDFDFALKSFRASTTADGNSVTSPYGLTVDLSMVRAGASGNTRTQIDSVLGAGSVSNWDVARNTQALMLAQQKGRTLSVANGVFLQKGYPFERPYLDTLATYYGAGVYPVDFEHNTGAASKSVDRFASDKTHGMVKGFGSPPDSNTRAVLVNAAYMNAKWEDPFEADDTYPTSFTTLNGGPVTTDFMKKTDQHLDYTDAGNYEIASLPYKGGMSMLVLLPKEGKFTDVRQSLSGADLLRARQQMSSRGIGDLELPKFKVTSEADLGAALQQMGMTDAFDAQRADFSKMSSSALSLSGVEQKAVIEVNEKGTKAAAVTKSKFMAVGNAISTGEDVNFIVNRPFMYFVVDDATNAVLFMGQVTDPTQHE